MDLTECLFNDGFITSLITGMQPDALPKHLFDLPIRSAYRLHIGILKR